MTWKFVLLGESVSVTHKLSGPALLGTAGVYWDFAAPSVCQCRWKRHGMEKGWIHPSSASAPQQQHLKTLCWLLHGGLKGKKTNIFLSLHETVNPDPSLVEDFVSCPWWWWHLIADENNYHETDWSHCLLVLLVFYEMIIDFNLRSDWTRKWFLAHASFVPDCADWNYDWGQWLWSIWNFKNQLSGKNYTCASRLWAEMVSPLPTIRYQQFVSSHLSVSDRKVLVHRLQKTPRLAS